MITLAEVPNAKRGGVLRLGLVMSLAMIVSAALLPAISISPASAHATAMLFGSHAKAGKRGAVTMRIPHGCNGNLATDKVTIKLSRKWKGIKAVPRVGWESQIRKGKRGRTIVAWTTVGEPLTPTATGDFKLRLRFPTEAGLYSLPTVQGCGSVKSKWNEPDRGGADGVHPYPADLPVPKIKVRG